MYPYLGDFPTGATIFFPFHTFNAAGASVTITGLAVTDIEIYKGASVTQRSSDAGYALVDTDGIDIDSITGFHGFTVDTSDNTDAGFYAAGNDYTVWVSAVTVDSQTVSFIAGRFSIDNRGLLRPTTAQRTLDVSATGAAGLDLNNIELPVGAIPSLGIVDNGTLQSATASTAVLRSAAALGDDNPNNSVIEITGGTGAGQCRLIVDYVTSTDTATVNPNWTTTPDNTSTYIVRAAPPAPTSSSYVPAVNTILIESADPSDTIRDAVVDDATRIDASALNTASVTTIPAILVDTADMQPKLGSPAGASMSADIAAVKVDTAAILVDTGTTLDGRIPAALVGGRMDSNVGAVSSDATAADNLEAMLDGTGGVTLTTALTGAITGNITGNLSGSVGSVTGSVASVTGNLGGTIGSLSTQAKADVNAEVVDALTVDVVADSVPADGSRPTLAQAAYMLVQFMTERSVSGTTMTVKKPDGSTSLYTLTLNDSADPTSVTRAS